MWVLGHSTCTSAQHLVDQDETVRVAPSYTSAGLRGLWICLLDFSQSSSVLGVSGKPSVQYHVSANSRHRKNRLRSGNSNPRAKRSVYSLADPLAITAAPASCRYKPSAMRWYLPPACRGGTLRQLGDVGRPRPPPRTGFSVIVLAPQGRVCTDT